MTRDFSKDLTIMVAGSGNATMTHLEESLAEWIFGSVDEREVHVILPVLSEMGPGVRNLIKLGMEWEFKFTVIQAKDAPMTRELSGVPEDSFVRMDGEREALEHGLSLLTERDKAGDETAFFLAYDPKSTYEQGNPALSDFEIIGDAKNYQWLTTLNLCEGLIDSFEGFETTDEMLKRERLQREFEDKQRAEEAAKPKPAKKAVATRKRAVKKVEPQESKPLVAEAEKPLQEPSEAKTEDPWNGVNKGFPNPHREPLPGNPVHDNKLSANVTIAVPTPDIQEDIREAHAEIVKRNTVAVSRDDLADLSQNIKELSSAFGNIMDTFTRILKDS
jgi:hypothetical protein